MITTGQITRCVDQAKSFTVRLDGAKLDILLLLSFPSELRNRFGINRVAKTMSWSIQAFHTPISKAGIGDMILLL